MMCLERAPAGTATDLAAPLEQVAETVRKRGLVVLISDLLAPVDDAAKRSWAICARAGTRSSCSACSTRRRSIFRFSEAAMFHDVEIGPRAVRRSASRPRASTSERFAEHARGARRARAASWASTLYELTTDRPLELALFDLLSARMRRGRQVARRQAAAAVAGRRRPLMSILAPLYLAGLAALSLPLIFHLIRRTPRGRQEFSSLMFLSPSPPRLTRRSRLDQILLLLLRLAALALLAFAFARPFLREAATLALDDLPARRVAILVDTSASMRRGDLWQQAHARRSRSELADLGPHDEVALFAFGDRLQDGRRFRGGDGRRRAPARPTSSGSSCKKLRPTWGGDRPGRGAGRRGRRARRGQRREAACRPSRRSS